MCAMWENTLWSHFCLTRILAKVESLCSWRHKEWSWWKRVFNNMYCSIIFSMSYGPPLSYLHGRNLENKKLMPVWIMNNANLISKNIVYSVGIFNDNVVMNSNFREQHWNEIMYRVNIHVVNNVHIFEVKLHPNFQVQLKCINRKWMFVVCPRGPHNIILIHGHRTTSHD